MIDLHAVGTTLEFRPRDENHVDDMAGGGPFGLHNRASGPTTPA